MTIKKINGSIIISDIVNGYRTERQYMGYSVREATRKFKQETTKPIQK
jgi:hypothetical protein